MPDAGGIHLGGVDARKISFALHADSSETMYILLTRASTAVLRAPKTYSYCTWDVAGKGSILTRAARCMLSLPTASNINN